MLSGFGVHVFLWIGVSLAMYFRFAVCRLLQFSCLLICCASFSGVVEFYRSTSIVIDLGFLSNSD